MPRINTYSDNVSIENDDKMLTYDTQAAATKLTAFSIVWNWIVSKLHALTSSGAALTPSTDRVLMDKNGTMTRVEPAAVARYGIETYNGSTIAGSAQTVKSALDTLNSNTEIKDLGSKSTLSDFNNSLTTLASTMNSKQIYNIRIVASGSALSPFQYATYYGTLTKNTSTSFFAHLSCGLDEIHGEYVNNNWTWVKIA